MHLTHKLLLAALLSGMMAAKTCAQGSRPAPTGKIGADSSSSPGMRYPQYQPRPTGRIEQPLPRQAGAQGNLAQPGRVPNAFTTQDPAANPAQYQRQGATPAKTSGTTSQGEAANTGTRQATSGRNEPSTESQRGNVIPAQRQPARPVH
ncbi:hypothetical protein [Dyadobacter sandarakinus]|uniref:Lipoprotein n=1 Tax=Dyadobacter sandarakinus TaxID=2747268 RepID=A0ABX7I308_9BACT|nr:hypothetical protein [Dyadobacter sandarakinus]QRR00476.1 hypothetical protein HWI92_05915 [Dyadobacter sandarakinus]